MSLGFATRYDSNRAAQLQRLARVLKSWRFGFSQCRYYTILAANNKGADQTARMRRLICAFVVRIWHKLVFSWWGSYIVQLDFWKSQTSEKLIHRKRKKFTITAMSVYVKNDIHRLTALKIKLSFFCILSVETSSLVNKLFVFCQINFHFLCRKMHSTESI